MSIGNSMIQNRRYWLMACIIMIAIIAASNIPNLSLYDGHSLPPAWQLWIRKHTMRFGTNGFFSYAISLHPDFVLHKLGHIFAYGFLGVALYMATSCSAKWGISIAAIFAASDEMHQHFIAGRSSRFWDIMLDILAATCFIYLRICKQRKLERASASGEGCQRHKRRNR